MLIALLASPGALESCSCQPTTVRRCVGHCMTHACPAAQVQQLCQGVTEAPPAPGAEQDAFFGQPRHILARMVRDVLATGDVPATIADIMPAIVQVRLRGAFAARLAKLMQGCSGILQASCHAGQCTVDTAAVMLAYQLECLF